tara:strand:+ start:13699 stop:14781 length:1083 start_codon:yes stop_codon:yes gene_type:complete
MCAEYNGININTRDVLAVMRFDYQTLVNINSILLTKSSVFILDLYFYTKIVMNKILATAQSDSWNSFSSFSSNNFIINSTENTMMRYTPTLSYCCSNKNNEFEQAVIDKIIDGGDGDRSLLSEFVRNFSLSIYEISNFSSTPTVQVVPNNSPPYIQKLIPGVSAEAFARNAFFHYLYYTFNDGRLQLSNITEKISDHPPTPNLFSGPSRKFELIAWTIPRSKNGNNQYIYIFYRIGLITLLNIINGHMTTDQIVCQITPVDWIKDTTDYTKFNNDSGIYPFYQLRWEPVGNDPSKSTIYITPPTLTDTDLEAKGIYKISIHNPFEKPSNLPEQTANLLCGCNTFVNPITIDNFNSRVIFS